MWCAVLMLVRRFVSKKMPLEAFRVTAPPNKNAVERLLTLQEAITEVEGLIQTANIVLLKLRAILLAVLPQVYVLMELNPFHVAITFLQWSIYILDDRASDVFP